MTTTTLRLSSDTQVLIRPNRSVTIEQGDYIDTDPDYHRDIVTIDKAEMCRLVQAWLPLLITDPES